VSRQGDSKLLFSVAHSAIHTVLGVQEFSSRLMRLKYCCKLQTRVGGIHGITQGTSPRQLLPPNHYSIKRPGTFSFKKIPHYNEKQKKRME
jgi:hypothetical protein